METINVKEIVLKVIPAKAANAFVRKWHYSGKVVNNSVLHFGCFYNNVMHGVMSFGPSINKKGTINLVKDTGWNEFLELNRMAFDEVLPKNSESRCLSVAIKLIKKNAPHVRWIITFADGTQCGDGTIYRAAGFKLMGIVKNEALRENPETGEPMHIIQAHHLKIKPKWNKWKLLEGKQLKYVYLIDKTCELTQQELPYSAIEEAGAGMYKGIKKAAN